jgi:hypothetical protein
MEALQPPVVKQYIIGGVSVWQAFLVSRKAAAAAGAVAARQQHQHQQLPELTPRWCLKLHAAAYRIDALSSHVHAF